MQGLQIEIIEHVKKLWDYMTLKSQLHSRKAIVCLGSGDRNVALEAATLWHKAMAPLLIATGGIAHKNDLAKTAWEHSEAEEYKEIFLNSGIPEGSIILESKATNTAENFLYSSNQLKKYNISIEDCIIVSKPYMMRRAERTADKLFPNHDMIFHSMDIDLSTYLKLSENPNTDIELIVGDVARTLYYPDIGYMARSIVPKDVLIALELLIKKGYKNHLPLGFNLKEYL